MVTVMIDDLDDRTIARLEEMAAHHGNSLEVEILRILDNAVSLPEDNIGAASYRFTQEHGSFEPEIPGREEYCSRWEH